MPRFYSQDLPIGQSIQVDLDITVTGYTLERAALTILGRAAPRSIASPAIVSLNPAVEFQIDETTGLTVNPGTGKITGTIIPATVGANPAHPNNYGALPDGPHEYSIDLQDSAGVTQYRVQGTWDTRAAAGAVENQEEGVSSTIDVGVDQVTIEIRTGSGQDLADHEADTGNPHDTSSSNLKGFNLVVTAEDQVLTVDAAGDVVNTKIIGAADGIAPLGSDSKVPSANLPGGLTGGASVLQGEYSAATNSPNLSIDPSPFAAGDYWVVNSAGNQAGIDWDPGDWRVLDNPDPATWRRIGAEVITQVSINFLNSPYSASSGELIYVDCSTSNPGLNPVIVQLPNSQPLGSLVEIKKISSDLIPVQVNTTGGETLETNRQGFEFGSSTEIDGSGGLIRWAWSGSNWLMRNELKQVGTAQELYDGVAIPLVPQALTQIDLTLYDPLGQGSYYWAEAAGLLTCVRPFIGSIAVLAGVSCLATKDEQAEIAITAATTAALSRMSAIYATFVGNKNSSNQNATLGNGGAWGIAAEVGDTLQFFAQSGVGSGVGLLCDLDSLEVGFLGF